MANIKFMKVDGVDAVVIFTDLVNDEWHTLKSVQHTINEYLQGIKIRAEETKIKNKMDEMKALSIEKTKDIAFMEDETFSSIRKELVSQIGQEEFEKVRYSLTPEGKIGPKKI